MNKVVLVGRLTRDPEVRYTTGENATCIARFSVAVNRRFKNSNGEYQADFINCVGFGKTGEFIEKYFSKGKAIGIVGRIQTGNYTNKDGNKVYTTDVVVEEAEFVESKKNSDGENVSQATQNVNSKSIEDEGFMQVPDDDEEGLPFN